MDRNELKDILKEKLKIEVKVYDEQFSGRKMISTKLIFDEEVIDIDEDCISWE